MEDSLGFYIFRLVVDLWKHRLKKITLNVIYATHIILNVPKYVIHANLKKFRYQSLR